jgi:branched-subunit amino acid ABC-type transport system permease component
MSNASIYALVAAAICLVFYLMRRRSRLNHED